MPEPHTTNSLAGSFLIAHPGLSDPSFHRSVIMLANHDAKDGSFGLILNRPTGKLVGDLLSDATLGPVSQVPVLYGGPVQNDQLLLAAFRWHPATRMLECRHPLSIAEAEELIEAPDHTVRGFIGYAGWGSGQLEGELAQRSWLVRRADQAEVLEIDRAPHIWRDLTSTFGPWFQLAAESPEDPSQN